MDFADVEILVSGLKMLLGRSRSFWQYSLLRQSVATVLFKARARLGAASAGARGAAGAAAAALRAAAAVRRAGLRADAVRAGTCLLLCKRAFLLRKCLKN